MSLVSVLVVDDEPGIRSGIERILRGYSVGYPFMDEDFTFQTIEAGSGEEAIEILNSRQIDIMLLDNKLPGKDGIEVLEYVNNKGINTLVMMITSYASLDLAVKATNMGAYNFVPKPFTPQELKSAIDNITKHLFLRRMTNKMNEEGKSIRFQFLSVLSHELKSPINAIEGYLKMMQEKQLGEDIDDYMQMIDRSIVRIKGMRSLIMDLLDLTKIESGDKTRNITKLDLCEVIKLSIDAMLPMAIQRNVKIIHHLPESAVVYADSRDAEIVMNNLLSNAIKYNKEGGEVEIFLKLSTDGLLLKVSDTGIGMTKDDQSKLFGEFVRIKNAKTKHITGSGLGLSIVKRLIEEYKGTISVESEPDKGSVFTVFLPKK